MLAAVPTVFFAMTGAEITTIAAAESAQPGQRGRTHEHRRDLAHPDFLCGSMFLIVSVTPWNTFAPGESPFTLALNTMHVPWARRDHERDHPHRRAVVFEFGVLRELARAVHPGRPPATRRKLLVNLNSRRVPVVSVLMGSAGRISRHHCGHRGARRRYSIFWSVPRAR